MPRVSIGLPVYNGQNYLQEAIESILSQTFEDFELIISDNASTDRTQEICREYAAKEPRIRYYRNKQNLGAAFNFNHVFKLSTGEYFKWAAHDDMCASELLSKCVRILDYDPSIVLCHSKVKIIDENGNFLKNYNLQLNNVGSDKPQDRFADLVLVYHLCFIIFGLIRACTLRRTHVIGPYVTSDRNLLAELGLLGRFYEIPEYLLSIRYHPGRSVAKRRHDRAGWFDPAKEGRIVFVHWRMFFEYLRSINRVPVKWSVQKDCYYHMVRWLGMHWRLMRGDLRIAMIRLLKDLVGQSEVSRAEKNSFVVKS